MEHDTKPNTPAAITLTTEPNQTPRRQLRPHDASPRSELLFGTPRLFVSVDAYKRMCLYSKLLPMGGDWVGTVVPLEDGNFLISRVFLIRQKVSDIITEVSEDGIHELREELLDAGAGSELALKLRFCGRSHARPGCDPVQPDDTTMARFGQQGHDFFVRGIFSSEGRAAFDVYYYKFGIVVRDIEWMVVDDTGKVLLDKSFAYFRRFSGTLDVRGIGNRPIGGLHYPPDKPLPPELVPDDVLVAEVEAEIKLKVTASPQDIDDFYLSRWPKTNTDEQ